MHFAHQLPLILFVEKRTAIRTRIGWEVDARRVRLGHKVTLVTQGGKGSFKQREMVHLGRNNDHIK